MSINTITAYPTGPTALSPASKTPQYAFVRLTFADFTTGGTASVKAVLPKDASIVGFDTWTKTTFSGNGVTAVAIQIGVSGTVAKYLASSTLSLTSGAGTFPTALGSGAFAEQGVETGDISLLFTGTATTGNPTAGEAYVLVKYVM